MKRKLEFKINSKAMSLEADEDARLLWLIRTDLGLTGTKCGCGEGFCGACTVLVNGKAVRSCQVTAGEIQAKELLTIEGLSPGRDLHPLQKAFVAHGALQCGFWVPGWMMPVRAMLPPKPAPEVSRVIGPVIFLVGSVVGIEPTTSPPDMLATINAWPELLKQFEVTFTNQELEATLNVPPLVPGQEDQWRALAAAEFSGRVELGDDLLRISVGSD